MAVVGIQERLAKEACKAAVSRTVDSGKTRENNVFRREDK